MNVDAGYLRMYDGGSEHAEIIDNLIVVMNDTKISTPRNQIFVILDTNGNNDLSVRLNARVLKSKCNLIKFNEYLLLFSVCM